jgi:hypothetical protein
MISEIITVLPTPAPPNNPTFPPRTIGAKKSTTLIPVGRSSWGILTFAKVTSEEIIGRSSVALRGPNPSWGYPKVLTTRPSNACPTGTLID